MGRRLEKVCDEADTAKCACQNLGGGYVGVPCADRTNETTERKLPSQHWGDESHLQKAEDNASRDTSVGKCMLCDHISGDNVRKALPCPGDSQQAKATVKPRSFLGFSCLLLDITSKIENRPEFLKPSSAIDGFVWAVLKPHFQPQFPSGLGRTTFQGSR